jgi:tetratricopeptide (TPR) repeat protein
MSNNKLLETKEAFRLNAFFEALVDEQCEAYTPGIESITAFRKRQRAQLENVFIDSLEMVSEGIAYILGSHHFTKKEKEHYRTLLASYKKIESSLEKGQAIFASGNVSDPLPTIGETLGLDEEFYEKALQIGMEALDHKKTHEAKKCFMALCQLSPLSFQFSQGLGLALLDEKDYEGAKASFINALQIADDENAGNIALLVINTFILSGQLSQAKEMAQILVDEIGDHEIYADELKRVQKLLQLL